LLKLPNGTGGAGAMNRLWQAQANPSGDKLLAVLNKALTKKAGARPAFP
jgi:hypothetical protein